MDNSWLWLEIVVIVLIVSFFAALISIYIYKKTKHIPTGDCAACAGKSKRMLKEYRKMYPKCCENKGEQ